MTESLAGLMICCVSLTVMISGVPKENFLPAGRAVRPPNRFASRFVEGDHELLVAPIAGKNEFIIDQDGRATVSMYWSIAVFRVGHRMSPLKLRAAVPWWPKWT